MNRLIVGSLVSVPLIITMACSGDPTDSLRNGIAQVNASPTQVFPQVGRTTNIDVTANDEQGNMVSTSFQAKAVNGSSISVIRDTTFQPVFINDSQAVAPAQAVTFRFKVTANALGVDTVTIKAGEDSVRVPVAVQRDPAVAPPFITVASTGPTAADATVLTVPAPYVFPEDVAVGFDVGNAIVVSRTADGSSITIFPPPGAASVGSAVLGLSYLPTDTVTSTTDVPLTISTSVPPQAGTDDPATAPVIALPAAGATTAFYDGAAFGFTCDAVGGPFPCQLYAISLPADGSFDASLGWSNTTDLGLYVLSADGTTATDQFCDANGNGDEGGAEACTITLPAGDYRIAVVNFGPFYDPVDPPPDWISLAITTPAE